MSLHGRTMRSTKRVQVCMTTNGRGIVIVTGASTGIGAATALHLRELGFSVLAGIRRDKDAVRLRDSELTPIRLDVTDPEQLAAACDEVGDRPLAGLVNNAGITMFGPLEFVRIEDLRLQFEVNVIGQIAAIQAFIGGLRAGHGRIVNVGSISGRLATPMIGPYAASKFALNAITDTLRRELALQGVDVVMVEPGGVKTPLISGINQRGEQLDTDGPPELTQRYGAMITTALEHTRKIDQQTGLDASTVAKVIGKALTVRRPRTRYLVGRDACLQAAMAKLLPDRVIDRLVLSQIRS
jgi:NAD(P)-dependent dehydrogenase (short-subunit alcohol dehydrogenase family)